MDREARLSVQKNGSLNGSFPVFTSKKKKLTKMVKITSANEGSSLAAKSNPMGEFVATSRGSEDTFILRVNTCDF